MDLSAKVAVIVEKEKYNAIICLSRNKKSNFAGNLTAMYPTPHYTLNFRSKLVELQRPWVMGHIECHPPIPSMRNLVHQWQSLLLLQSVQKK